MLFNAKVMDVCVIHTGRLEIKDGDCFPIFETLGIASLVGICTMSLYLMVIIYLKFDESTNVPIISIRANRNSLLNGVFVLPIGNSSCHTTLVVVMTFDCGIVVMFSHALLV